MLPGSANDDPKTTDAITNASLHTLMLSINNKLDTLTATADSTKKDLTTLKATAVTKDDLQAFHNTITHETRSLITTATTPIHEDVKQLTTKLASLTTRVDTLDPTATSSNSPLQATIKRQQAALNKLDPAHKSITFIGFPDNFLPPQRSKFLSDYLRINVPQGA